MQTAYALIGIGGERLIEGVVTVRRYERLPARKAAHHGRVIKIPRRSPELHQIPDFELSQRHFFRKRTRAFVVREKAIEIFDARPRRRSVVGADIIPPHDGGIVHDVAARVHALRGKIGAIAAEAAEIIISGVASVRPFAGVLHRRFAVIGDPFQTVDHFFHTVFLCSGGEKRCRRTDFRGKNARFGAFFPRKTIF